MIFEVVGHEVGHQWWGMQLKPAWAEGGGVISEGLAWYSTMQTVKNAKGREALRRRAGLRLVLLLVALAIWTALTVRHATRNPVAAASDDDGVMEPLSRRDLAILALVLTPLATYVVGVLTLDWGSTSCRRSFSSPPSSLE